MKKVQKIIIIIYLILVAIACIYVPWKIDYVVENDVHEPSYRYCSAYRYSVFWKSPSLKNLARLSSYEKMNIKEITMERWIIPYELVALTAIFGVLFVLTLWPKKHWFLKEVQTPQTVWKLQYTFKICYFSKKY